MCTCSVTPLRSDMACYAVRLAQGIVKGQALSPEAWPFGMSGVTVDARSSEGALMSWGEAEIYTPGCRDCADNTHTCDRCGQPCAHHRTTACRACLDEEYRGILREQSTYARAGSSAASYPLTRQGLI